MSYAATKEYQEEHAQFLKEHKIVDQLLELFKDIEKYRFESNYVKNKLKVIDIPFAQFLSAKRKPISEKLMQEHLDWDAETVVAETEKLLHHDYTFIHSMHKALLFQDLPIIQRAYDHFVKILKRDTK